MADHYVMPHVEIGDIVLWYPDAIRSNNTDEMAHVGIVTRIGYDSLNLNVLSPTNYNFQIRDGVRHLDDPRATYPELREQGGWDFTPAAKRVKAVEKKLQLVFEHLAREGNKHFAETLARELEESRKAKAAAAK